MPDSPWFRHEAFGLTLKGAEAVEWVQSWGWSLHGGSGPLQVSADLVVDDGFVVGRIRHTAARWICGEAMAPPESFVASLGLSGTHELKTARGVTVVPPGAMAIGPFVEDVELVSDQPVARILIVSRWDRLAVDTCDRQEAHSNLFVDALRHTLELSLDRGVTPVDSGFPAWRMSVESMLAAAMTHGENLDVDHLTAAEAVLVRTVTTIIGSEHTDPELTVESIARRLEVSPQRLHQVFSLTGATVGGRLRHARAMTARAHLRSRPGLSAADRLHVARVSGFPTVRTMMAAVARL